MHLQKSAFPSPYSQADVEESPEISFDISAPLDSMVHNQMLFHPCVQLTDSVTPILAKSGDQFGSRKLRFFPPTNQFNLCQYKLTLPEDNMPVKAFYQMKVKFGFKELINFCKRNSL